MIGIADPPARRALADAVGEEEARGRLARRRGWVRFWPSLRSIEASLALELVRLPVAVATMAERGAGRGERWFVVERVLGHGWSVWWDSAATGGGAREAADPATGVAALDEALLPARLATADCRRSLEALALRTALASRRVGAVDSPSLERIEASSYPFWVVYRRGRRGRIDFDALDAVTGRRAGSALRAAIAAALIDADRAPDDASRRPT